jgi:hypothetical protein
LHLHSAVHTQPASPFALLHSSHLYHSSSSPCNLPTPCLPFHSSSSLVTTRSFPCFRVFHMAVANLHANEFAHTCEAQERRRNDRMNQSTQDTKYQNQEYCPSIPLYHSNQRTIDRTRSSSALDVPPFLSPLSSALHRRSTIRVGLLSSIMIVVVSPCSPIVPIRRSSKIQSLSGKPIQLILSELLTIDFAFPTFRTMREPCCCRVRRLLKAPKTVEGQCSI